MPNHSKGSRSVEACKIGCYKLKQGGIGLLLGLLTQVRDRNERHAATMYILLMMVLTGLSKAKKSSSNADLAAASRREPAEAKQPVKSISEEKNGKRKDGELTGAGKKGGSGFAVPHGGALIAFYKRIWLHCCSTSASGVNAH